MFDQTFVNAQAQTRKPWTVLASLSLQTALIAVALIAPLLHIAKLEVPARFPLLRMPVREIDIKVKPEVTSDAHPVTATRPVFQRPVLTVPTSVPKFIDTTPDPPSIAAPSVGPAGPVNNALAGLVTEIPPQRPREDVKPRPPAPVSSPSSSTPVHVGGSVQAALLVYSPRPPYPPIAKATRTQGTVVIRAIIARDGAIRNLQLISGPPLLAQAAMDAVRQWRYKPTSLNGEAVEVLTEIQVNFTLSQ
jgi:periplasmic protein TonB